MNDEWERKKAESDAVMQRFQEAADALAEAKYEWDYWRFVVQWGQWAEVHRN